MHEKKLQVGFTLAEVLITLGIIGIVAAMTMPMLLAKYQNMVLLTRVKKTYSTITNAINLAKADIGDTTNITSIFNLSNTSVQTLETMKKYFTGAVLCESVNTCPNYPVKAQYGQSNVITGAMEYRDRFSPPYLKLADGSFLKISQYSSCSTMRTATKCITDSSGNPVANSDGSDCEREEYEWLDRYKAVYSELVISVMMKSVEDIRASSDENRLVKVADCILREDALDESAVRLKCRILYAKGHKGLARDTYDKWCADYRRAMADDPQLSYNDIVMSL